MKSPADESGFAEAAARQAADRRRLVRALGGSAQERQAALEEIGTRAPAERAGLVDEELAAALVALLGSDRRSEQRAAAEAIALLAAEHATVAEALRASLGSSHQRLRWGAAFTLARSALPLAPLLWPAVREAMALDDDDQRWAAAELAARLASAHPAVLDELRSALSSSPSTLRKMALYCLREVAPADLATLATSLLADREPSVRLAALAALVRAPGSSADRTRAADGIAKRLEEDDDAGVRRAAAAALGNLGVASAEVAQALAHAASDADTSLARAARGALARLSAPAAGASGTAPPPPRRGR